MPLSEPNEYGIGRYGTAQYGDLPFGNSGVLPSGNNCIPIVQQGYCFLYPRFQFSGINLGTYIFETNPTLYDVFPQRTTQSYPTVMNTQPTIDEAYNKIEIQMSWDWMPATMWEAITRYAIKNIDGTSPYLLFYDYQFGRFCGTTCKIEAFYSQLQGGYDPLDRLNVTVKLRQV